MLCHLTIHSVPKISSAIIPRRYSREKLSAGVIVLLGEVVISGLLIWECGYLQG